MDTELLRPRFSNCTASDPHDVSIWDKPLYALLDDAAKNYPHRNAVIYQNTRITYKSLLKQAEIFAGALRRIGVTPGQRIAIMLPNLPQTVIAFWGVVKAGAVVVMLNPLYMETELLGNILDSGAEHIIIMDNLWPRVANLRERLKLRSIIVTSAADSLSFPLSWLTRFKAAHQHGTVIPYDGKIVFAWEAFCKGAQRLSAPIANPVHDTLMIQYTGGTTGLPKGVPLSHTSVGTNHVQFLQCVNENAGTHHTFISILPFFHIYGLACSIVIPTALAATVLPLPRYVPQDVLRLIAKYRPTVFPSAPSIFISLLQQKNLSLYDLRCIKISISASAPLPREIYRRFQEITGAMILEAYGLTETSPFTHINPPGSGKQKEGSIGIPLPGTNARIVDNESGTSTLSPGKMGELVIKGPQVMQGYWNKANETANALRNGWLYTGDLAVMDEDGYFFIVDRKKDMVIVSGYNVYPREVDEVLMEHPGVLEAVSVGIRDNVRGEILKAYVVPRQGHNMTKAQIISWCRQKLASYKVPRSVEFRDELPKTIVGKVLRRKLREEEEGSPPQ